MKILILHQFFHTPEAGGPLRSYYLAQALLQNGHEVSVITTGSQSDTRQVDGIEVHYLPVPYENSFGYWKRGKAFTTYIIQSLRALRNHQQVDYIYAISAPLTVGFIALIAKSWWKKKYLFEVGDLWPEAPIQLGYIRHPLLKWLLFRLEKSIYNHSEAVVALSPAIAGDVQKTAPNKKVVTIPNLSDCSYYKPVAKRTSLEGHPWQEQLVITYIGALGFANGLHYVLDCARAAARTSASIRFVICGEGAKREELKSLAEKFGLKNMTFLPFTNREGVRKILDASDAALVCYRPVPVLETGSPHKFFDGLAAGKLIVLNVSGWMEEEVRTNRCGFSADASQPEDLLRKLAPFIADAGLLQEYQHNARALAERSYSREILGARFAALFA